MINQMMPKLVVAAMLSVVSMTACSRESRENEDVVGNDAGRIAAEHTTAELKEQKIFEYKNQLAFAEKKDDLDQIYLAILNLADLGEESPALKLKLKNVEEALDLIQKARSFEAAGRYEEAIDHASLALVLFPSHSEASRIKVEGQAYLDERRKRDASRYAQIDSAVRRGDIEGIVSFLQSLDKLTIEQMRELDRAKNAAALLEKIKVARERHLHEQVVWLADEVLDLFPSNPEAANYMRESGLIFAYLKEANELLKQCYPENGFAKGEEIASNYLGYGEVVLLDYSSLQQKLANAERFIGEALKLDPDFEHAKLLADQTGRMKNLIGIFGGLALIQEYGEMVEALIYVYHEILGMHETVLEGDNDTGHLKSVMEVTLIKMRKTVALKFDELDELLGSLDGLRTQENKRLIDAVIPMLQPLKDMAEVFLTLEDDIDTYQQKGLDSRSGIMEELNAFSIIADHMLADTFIGDIKTIIAVADTIDFFSYEATPKILEKHRDLIETK